MDLPSEIGHVESRFNPSGYSVIVSAKLVHGLRQTYYRLRNHFGRIRWTYSVILVMWNLVPIHLETVLVSVQDRCMVCPKHSSKIVLDALQWHL
jgi:hypothetical protein